MTKNSNRRVVRAGMQDLRGLCRAVGIPEHEYSTPALRALVIDELHIKPDAISTGGKRRREYFDHREEPTGQAWAERARRLEAKRQAEAKAAATPQQSRLLPALPDDVAANVLLRLGKLEDGMQQCLGLLHSLVQGRTHQ